MSGEVTRRDFIKKTAGAAAALGAGTAGATDLSGPDPIWKKLKAPTTRAGGVAPSGQIIVGLVGCGSRGANVLMDEFMKFPEVRVGALCDPDSNRVNQVAAQIEKKQGTRPAVFNDYRRLLEMKDLNVAHVATPDHWHCLPACHACEVGLDVYVEKPIGHSIVEGRAMVNAARKYGRVVQVGTQQRSAKHFREAVEFVWSGQLGQISLVRTWNNDYEMPNGLGPGTSEIPAGVDYNMWTGPAPWQAFNSNRFHYQWRWFFDYAGGMLCDWGIHLIDIAQWGMKATAPTFISATGAKYAIPDNRDTPDTVEAVFQFPGTEVAPKGFMMTYSNSKACAQGTRARGYGIEFHGVNGSLFVDRGGWEVLPVERDKKPLIEKQKHGGGTPTRGHVKNFLDCIKSRELPISDIEIGHRSTSTPQLANIALRSGVRLHWDADNEVVLNSREANRFLGRKYRAPWNKEARTLPLPSHLRDLLG